ncbi:isochorismatase family protein [Pseudoalteromonas xiamenensis]
MTTALIIIDTQDSFFHTPYWETSHFESFKQNMSDLVNYFQANNLPIVKVLHVDDVDQNSPFCLLNGFVKPMDFLPSKYDRVVHKTVHNAFTDTGLLRWLTRNGIRKLVISGIRTEQCCETTTRVASDSWLCGGICVGCHAHVCNDKSVYFESTFSRGNSSSHRTRTE